MKLTLEQIRSIALGVARVEETDGRIHLMRFTKAQELMYKERQTDFYEKTFATAGVTLEFETDSRCLGLSLEVTQASSRKFFNHSIFVNGNRIGEVYGEMEKGVTLACEKSFTLGEGMKRVEILFPWSAASCICAMTLDDGAVLRPVQKKCTMLQFGDSITHGYDALLPENSYASQIAHWLDANAINKAIGGEVFCPALAQLQDAVQPELITVAYGTNDWSKTGRQVFQENSLEFYRSLRKHYPGAKIVALAPIWRADMDLEKPAGLFRDVARHLASIAREVENMEFVDCFDFVPKDPQYFMDLRLHPNDAGFAHYSDGLRRQLTALGLK